MTPNPAPAEFKHYAKLWSSDSKYDSGGKLMFDIFKMFPPAYGGQVWLGGSLDHVCPLSGPAKFGDIEGWVQNQEKQGFVNIWFKSKSDYETVFQEVEKSKKKNLDGIKHKLYRVNQYGSWELSQSYNDRKRINLVGYDEYIEKLSNDIQNYKKHKEFLKSVGENKSLNYLFYGPPGCGKTTMALVIASVFDLPIYIMSALSRKYSLMTPTEPGPKILLFEDFDRYLSGASSSMSDKNINDSGHMSDILNSLDGLNSGDEIIRIFTGNNCKIIFENAALINRMSCCLKFDSPSREMFREKFKAILPKPDGLDDTKLEKLLDLLGSPPKVTLRPFVNYVIRYLFNENYLDDMIKNINELIFEVDTESV